MKRTFFLLASILVSTVLMAAPVSKDEAFQKAMQFVSKRQAPGKQLRLAPRRPLVVDEMTADISQRGEESSAYYVFNVGDDEGFVIASGDSRTSPILGYCDHGSFDAERLPVNMKAWLEDCARQIELVNASGAEDMNASGVAKAPSVRRAMGPLLTTQWDQDYPYNNLCPNKMATGCVATAMAQMMYYHAQLPGRPAATINNIPSYTTLTYGITVAGAPAGTVIEWDKMLPKYPSKPKDDPDYEASEAAVANLFRIVGASVSMDYISSNNSGASTSVVPWALKHYFGYDSGTRLVKRSSYQLSQWNELVYNELDEGRPVLISGNSSSTSGHAFMVDGFDGEELFHINWGWDGFCDGYFLLSVANPGNHSGIGAGNSDNGYTIDQEAIIGAQPDTGEGNDEGLQMTFYNLRIDGNKILYDAFNQNPTTEKMDFGLGYIDNDGNITPINLSIKRAELPTTYGLVDLRCTITPGTMAEGKYKIVTISKANASDKWLTRMNPDFNYIEAAFTSSSVTLTMYPLKSLELVGLKFADTAVKGFSQDVLATVKNNGEEFYGTLYLFAQSLEQNPSIPDVPTESMEQSVGATILPGATTTLSMSFKPKMQGNYHVWITTDSKGTEVVGTGVLNVVNESLANVSDSVIYLDNVDVSVRNVDSTGKLIVGTQAEVVATMTNPTDVDYEGFVKLILPKVGESIQVTSTEMSIKKRVPAHSTVEFTEFLEAESGSQYCPMAIWEYRGNLCAKQASYYFYYGVAPSATAYMADGTRVTVVASKHYDVPEDAVAVNLIGNSTTTSVTPNSNPNCLYYLSEGAETPAGLTTNVVVGSRAELVTISDEGTGLYPIKNFVADSITYTCTFSEGVGVDKAVWTTICLPFNVDTCLVGSPMKQTGWKSAIDDDTQNFWLMKFLGDEYGKLYFAHSEEFLANTPYLLAVPGKGLKDHDNMVGVPVVFTGHDAPIFTDAKAVMASSRYKFVGTDKVTDSGSRGYGLQSDGEYCVRDNFSVSPFQAYFAALRNVSLIERVPLVIEADLTVEADGIVEPLNGDVNNDGKVDVADIASILSAMAGTASEEIEAAADVNNDGRVDVADISSVLTRMAEL